MNAAVVLFSGGQDSTTCLFYALARYDAVWTIGFDYGQRHAVELKSRLDVLNALRSLPKFAAHLRDDVVVPVPGFSLLDSNALTGDAAITLCDNGLPSTFVPARNVLFLSYAAAYAYGRSISTLVCGVSETDFSGYPDCRQSTITSVATSLSLALDRPITIETPLMQKSKAETWELAFSLGGAEAVSLIRRRTHTCYANDHRTWNDFGYGCGHCPSCLLRKKGWEEFCRAHCAEMANF